MEQMDQKQRISTAKFSTMKLLPETEVVCCSVLCCDRALYSLYDKNTESQQESKIERACPYYCNWAVYVSLSPLLNPAGDLKLMHIPQKPNPSLLF